MSELIEKQKVLDVLREIATEKFSLDDSYGVYINVLIDVEEKICRLPVVQPNGPDNLVKDSQGLAKDLVNDCISRQVAIERATKDHDFYKGATIPADMARRDELLNVMCWLGELPSAQPYTDEEIQKMQDIEQAQFYKIHDLAYQEGKADAMRWISCADRLPEYGEKVITINEDEDYEINHIIDEDTGEWFYEGAIAWMPLPKPPKER